MVISLSEIGPFLVAFGAILGVWVRAELSISTLKERTTNQKEAISKLENTHVNYQKETKETVDKIYKTLDEITKQLYTTRTNFK